MEPRPSTWPLKKLAGYLALAGGLVWYLKVLLIALTGGADSDFVGVSITYLIAIVCYMLGAALSAWVLTFRRATWVRALSAVVAGALAWLVMNWIDYGIKAAYESDHWMRDEIAILVTATLSILLGWYVLAGSAANRQAAQAPA